MMRDVFKTLGVILAAALIVAVPSLVHHALAGTGSGGISGGGPGYPLPEAMGGTGQAALADGPQFKVKRATAWCSTAATLNATCTTTVPWATAFADANYTAYCIGLSTFTGLPMLQGETAKVAASV